MGDAAPGYTVCFFAFYTTGGTSSTGYASQCNADVPWTGDYGTPAAGSTPVPLDGGDTQEVDATLDAGGAVSGQVVEAAGTKQPIDDVNVLVFDSDGNSPFSVPTGTNGRYRINGLLPGQYWVCFDATNADGGTSTTGYVSKCYQTAPFDGFDVPAGAKPITVTAGANHQSVNGNLPAAGAVEGTVTDTDSNALTDYNVDAFDSDGNFVFVAATTDPNTGSYKLTGLPPSKTGYTICFDATEDHRSGDQRIRQSVLPGRDVGRQRPSRRHDADQLTSGQTAHGIDAHLATGGAITGTMTSAIVDEAGPRCRSALYRRRQLRHGYGDRLDRQVHVPRFGPGPVHGVLRRDLGQRRRRTGRLPRPVLSRRAVGWWRPPERHNGGVRGRRHVHNRT